MQHIDGDPFITPHSSFVKDTELGDWESTASGVMRQNTKRRLLQGKKKKSSRHLQMVTFEFSADY